LDLLWDALANMFDHDRSSARGKMATRRLIVFEHESRFGNAPAHKLFDTVAVRRIDTSRPPRAYSDYTVDVNVAAVPEGVRVIERV
jgi:CRISPR-associated protein Csd2